MHQTSLLYAFLLLSSSARRVLISVLEPVTKPRQVDPPSLFCISSGDQIIYLPVECTQITHRLHTDCTQFAQSLQFINSLSESTNLIGAAQKNHRMACNPPCKPAPPWFVGQKAFKVDFCSIDYNFTAKILQLIFNDFTAKFNNFVALFLQSRV